MIKAFVTWGLVALAFKMVATTWWGVPAEVFEPTLPPDLQEVTSEQAE